MAGRSIEHIEFATQNGAESAKFYSELFGWKVNHAEQFDYYTFAADGDVSGGFNNIANNPQLGFEVKPGTVVVYVSSDDIEADLARAEELGAKTVTPKMDIPGMGWFGVFRDTSGNLIGLYTDMPKPAAS